MVFGPGKARHDDHSLAIYEAAGFTSTQADQAMATVFTYVLGNALGAAAAASLPRKLSRDRASAEALIHDTMAKARDIAAQYPRLRARLEAPAAGYAAAPEHSFEFGLQVIFDGLEAQLTTRGTPAVENARKPPRYGQEPPGGPGPASGNREATAPEPVP